MSLSSKDTPRRLLQIGRIIKPHGIKGRLLVNFEKKFLPQIGQKVFFNLKNLLEGPFEITNIRKHKKFFLVELKEIIKLNDAEKFSGFAVGIKVNNLPGNMFWTEDLVGCRLYLSGGEKIGTVEEVIKTAANDILVSGDLMIPVTKNIIECIDIAKKTITVKNLEGLFE